MVDNRLSLASVARELDAVTATFADNELAYLAVTSKVELPLRDRLAWSLHSKLAPDFVVAREWKRTDLAVLDPHGQAVLLLEAKAMYAFDGCSEATWAKYSGYLRSDRDKARALGGDGTSILLLLLVTDIEGAIETASRDVIKYVDDLRRTRRRHSKAGAIRMACADQVRPRLEELGTFISGSLAAGQAFGLAVTIDYWLVEPS